MLLELERFSSQRQTLCELGLFRITQTKSQSLLVLKRIGPKKVNLLYVKASENLLNSIIIITVFIFVIYNVGTSIVLYIIKCANLNPEENAATYSSKKAGCIAFQCRL